jgi:hypothetical protein
MGTKVGERFLGGSGDYMSAEGEPARVVIEMGPVIGFVLPNRALVDLRDALSGGREKRGHG